MEKKTNDVSPLEQSLMETISKSFSGISSSIGQLNKDIVQSVFATYSETLEQLVESIKINFKQPELYKSIFASLSEMINSIYSSPSFQLIKKTCEIFPELNKFPLTDLEEFVESLPSELKDEIISFTPEQTVSLDLSKALDDFFLDVEKQDAENIEDKLIKSSIQQTSEKIAEDVFFDINLIHPELFNKNDKSPEGNHIKSLILFIISGIVMGFLGALGEDLYQALKTELFNQPAEERHSQEISPTQDPSFQNQPKYFADDHEALHQLNTDCDPERKPDLFA